MPPLIDIEKTTIKTPTIETSKSFIAKPLKNNIAPTISATNKAVFKSFAFIIIILNVNNSRD